MKRNLLFILSLCGTAAFLPSCDDGDTQLDYPEYTTVCYIEQYGLQEVDYYNVGQDVVYTTSIGKGGTDPNQPSRVTLEVMSDEELNSYNVENQTEYAVLPADYYSFTPEYELTSENPKQEIQITFKKELGTSGLDFDAIDYILPIRITNSTGSVNDEKSELLLRPIIMTPTVSVETPGLWSEPVSFHRSVDADYTLTVQPRIGIDVLNDNWTFQAGIERDRSRLQELVDRFNASSEAEGKRYLLLPEECYEIPATLDFPTYMTYEPLTVTLKRGTLYEGVDYLLPIVPESCEGMPFEVNTEDACYIPVTVNDELPQVGLSGKLSTNATGGESDVARLCNGIRNVGNWQTIWNTSGTEKPTIKYDDIYGVYVDIQNAGLTSIMNLNMYVFAQNNYPKKVRIYAGADESSLTEIASTDQAYETFNTDSEHVWSTGEINLAGKATDIIRISLLTNKNDGDLTGDLGWWQSGSTWYANVNVGLSEIELFGF